ncbi:methyl-accepting chemotaxis protein [uncultured Oxalicibacterium sp.]|uniref:methyl-accepting chemotaxis protein n=1 Tax=uncultured Oxalicibacterium sp. TaxID=1168540 RepID=UPI0025E916A7|nr:methyl-accepting chemotaxis protein [uncultured Oxalicibacterium sp.]
MLTNLSIKLRLVLTMTFMGLMLIVGGAMGVLGLQYTNNALQEVYTNQMPSAEAIQTMMIRMAQARATLNRVAMRPEDANAGSSIERSEMLFKQADESWKNYLALPANDEEKKLAAAVDSDRKAYLHELQTELIAALKAKQVQKAEDIILLKLSPLNQALVKSADALVDYQQQAAASGYNASQHMYGIFRWLAIGGILFGLLAVAVSASFLIRAITQPLQEMLRHFEAIASGDLTSRIEVRSKNEMGTLMAGLRTMQERLKETVAKVREGSVTISTATTEIAAGNLDLSSRTEQQAASLEETASSMEELTSTVKQNADNARQANQLAVSASEVATRGGSVVSEVVTTMEGIETSARKIVDIIGVIDGIAFQTNILALNAAVEAARAGEQGRGFAVVASEVRSLAQRSASAAKEIKTLIDDSVNKVDQGSRLVANAGATMQEVVHSVRNVTDIMSEIMAASQEQSSGIEQVNTAISQMDQVTQQNAALVEEAAAAAASLKEQANNLTEAVSIFRVNENDVITSVRAIPPTTTATSKPATKRITAVAATTTPKLSSNSKAQDNDWEEF